MSNELLVISSTLNEARKLAGPHARAAAWGMNLNGERFERAVVTHPPADLNGLAWLDREVRPNVGKVDYLA